MNAGRLNQRIRIEALSHTQDEAGQPSDTWALVADVWADVKLLGGMETIRSGAVTSSTAASIRIRWRDGLDAGMRVVHGSTVYNIRSVNPDWRSRQYIDLVCEVIHAQN